MKLASLAPLILLSACGGSSPPASSPGNTGSPPGLTAEGPEGIRGTVTILTGDFMPPGPPSGTAAPAANAPVHVFAGTLQPVAAIDPAAPAYRGTVMTDAEGRFQIALPAGTYTLVTEHDGAPYLNCQDGDGAWCATTISAGTWAELAIVDNAGATY